MLGYTNVGSARNAWASLKKKLDAMPVPENPKGPVTPSKATSEANGSAAKGAKTPRSTAGSKAGARKRKAAATDEEDELPSADAQAEEEDATPKKQTAKANGKTKGAAANSKAKVPAKRATNKKVKTEDASDVSDAPNGTSENEAKEPQSPKSKPKTAPKRKTAAAKGGKMFPNLPVPPNDDGPTNATTTAAITAPATPGAKAATPPDNRQTRSTSRARSVDAEAGATPNSNRGTPTKKATGANGKVNVAKPKGKAAKPLDPVKEEEPGEDAAVEAGDVPAGQGHEEGEIDNESDVI